MRVPVANLVGEENRGWDYAKFLLGNERVGITRVGLSKARLREASILAKRQLTRSGSLWTDPDSRQQFARLEFELRAAEMTAMPLLDQTSIARRASLTVWGFQAGLSAMLETTA
ncbi:MAG: acyl-CoA dehydrogenase family protein [Hyphomicrobiaceae bacterium]